MIDCVSRQILTVSVQISHTVIQSTLPLVSWNCFESGSAESCAYAQSDIPYCAVTNITFLPRLQADSLHPGCGDLFDFGAIQSDLVLPYGYHFVQTAALGLSPISNVKTLLGSHSIMSHEPLQCVHLASIAVSP